MRSILPLVLLASTASVAAADAPTATWVCARPDGSTFTQSHPCADGEGPAPRETRSEFDDWLGGVADERPSGSRTLCQVSRAGSALASNSRLVDRCDP